jgi:hypothetical protein
MSGLYFESKNVNGQSNILWAIKNYPPTMYKLLYDGSNWISDTSAGWGNGKSLHFPGGVGDPDAEDLTRGDYSSNDMYVCSERDGSGPSKLSILRYDLSQTSTSLTALQEWDVTLLFPSITSNFGFEGITWVPDEYLTSVQFVDENMGRVYNPLNYAFHGTGLFFVALESDGNVYALALNHFTGSAAILANFSSGESRIMSVHFDREVNYLWSLCDSACEERHHVMHVNSDGFFEHVKSFDKPGEMSAESNQEGLALEPESDCDDDGYKHVFWADDGNENSHAIRMGTIPCGDFLNIE